MKFDEIRRENEFRADRRRKLYREADSAALAEYNPILQYTLSSGTRCTIGGLMSGRLDITYVGGNAYASKEGSNFLTLGMLEAEDLREFLEIRLVIDAWRGGRLADLPMPKEPFDPWVCPVEFGVPLVGGED